MKPIENGKLYTSEGYPNAIRKMHQMMAAENEVLLWDSISQMPTRESGSMIGDIFKNTTTYDEDSIQAIEYTNTIG